MATTTTHYGFTKPGVNDYVDISVLNANFDNLDTVIYNNQLSAQAALDDLATAYDATATYSVGDYVTYNKTLYRCRTAITTAEAFDDTKWTAVKVGGELKSHNARISDLEAGVELEGAATNSFDDGIDSYFKKVESSIVPIQAGTGTPSPINERPITGHTECAVKDIGKNVCDTSGTDTTNGYVNGQYLLASGSAASPYSGYISEYKPIMGNTTYTISGFSGNLPAICFYDENKNYLDGVQYSNQSVITFTTPENTAYYRASILNSNVNTIQIELGSRATSYEPYSANIATIQFGAAGTVYGAKVDLISGKMVVNKGYEVFNGTERYEVGETSTFRYFNCLSATYPTNAWETNILSNEFAKQGTYPYVQFDSFKRVRFCFSINDTSVTTVAELQTLLQNTPAQIVYPLATPQEYQLTPAQLRSLVGANRLTSSTGEVTEVEYIKNKTIAWLLDLIRA